MRFFVCVCVLFKETGAILNGHFCNHFMWFRLYQFSFNQISKSQNEFDKNWNLLSDFK